MKYLDLIILVLGLVVGEIRAATYGNAYYRTLLEYVDDGPPDTEEDTRFRNFMENDLRKVIKNGYPPADIPVLDPFVYDGPHFVELYGFIAGAGSATFTDTTITGLSNYTLHKAKHSSESKEITVVVSWLFLFVDTFLHGDCLLLWKELQDFENATSNVLFDFRLHTTLHYETKDALSVQDVDCMVELADADSSLRKCIVLEMDVLMHRWPPQIRRNREFYNEGAEIRVKKGLNYLIQTNPVIVDLINEYLA